MPRNSEGEGDSPMGISEEELQQAYAEVAALRDEVPLCVCARVAVCVCVCVCEGPAMNHARWSPKKWRLAQEWEGGAPGAPASPRGKADLGKAQQPSEALP